MAKGVCNNCGQPSKYKLCPICFLEIRRRQKERAEDINKELNSERRKFLYGN